MHESCAQDMSFGPVSSCRTLDFTLYFEQTILGFAPDMIFFLLACARGFHLKSQPKPPSTARGNMLLALKCVVSLLVISGVTGSLVYGRLHHEPSAFVWLAAPVIQIICAVVLMLLVVIEHLHSIASSTLIITYTFIRGLFTAAALRSAIKTGLPPSGLSLSVLATASYFVVFLVELVPKSQTKSISSPSTSNILSRSLYIWLFPLMWAGRNKILQIDDCGSIPPEFDACHTRELLDSAILKHPLGKPPNLLRASLGVFSMAFLAPIFPRVLLLVATFSQPLLVLRMIKYVSESNPESERGWALVGGFVCVYGLMALMTSIYWEKVFDATVQYRAGLVGVIYSKSLRLSSQSGQELGGGVASTYMSVDVERICEGMQVFHETWAALASIALAVALLYTQATWPAFLPLAITLALSVIAAYISQGISQAHRLWLGSTDKRVKYLTSVLNNYLPMKMSCYEDVIVARAAKLRSVEMGGAQSFYNNICITGALAVTAGMLCNLSVLGPYAALAAHGHGPLDPSRMFTIAATLSLLAGPIDLIGGYMPQLIAAYASMKRIEDYLSRQEKPSVNNMDNQLENAPEKKSDYSITLQEASFSWDSEKSPVLGPLSITLTHGQLHMCVGPVAAGKSMFLLALLGETNCVQGSSTVPSVPFAYAVQEPLIMAGTLRNNILFGHEYLADWYNCVLKACALTSDIALMDDGDSTVLTEKGTNLSGGQRQRVSLARAVYAKAPWVFLDDTFSALDAQTVTHVFQSLFGPSGLLRNHGVVLVTHDLNHLKNADNIVVFNSGSIQYHGHLAEIIAAGYQMESPSTITHGEDSVEDIEKTSLEDRTYKEMKSSDEKAIQAISAGLTPYLFYMRVAGWGSSVAVVTLLSLTGCISLASNVYLQQWSQRSDNTGDTGKWVGGYAGLTLANFLMMYPGPCCKFLNFSFSELHAEELSGLLKTAPSYVMSAASGTIINRFSQDVLMCDLQFPVAALNVILFSVTLMGSIVFILIPAPWLALALPFVGVIYWVTLSFYLASIIFSFNFLTSKQFQHLTAGSKSPLYTLFSTTISGLVTIRTMGVEKHFQSLMDDQLNRSQIPFYYRLAGLRFLRTFLNMISLILATGLAALVIGLRKSVNPATLGLALSSLTNISLELSEL
ncbi:P-loop containing nucleoside triphosphate hydrolase protein, partial [Mycena belliarum]